MKGKFDLFSSILSEYCSLLFKYEFLNHREHYVFHFHYVFHLSGQYSKCGHAFHVGCICLDRYTYFPKCFFRLCDAFPYIMFKSYAWNSTTARQRNLSDWIFYHVAAVLTRRKCECCPLGQWAWVGQQSWSCGAQSTSRYSKTIPESTAGSAALY